MAAESEGLKKAAEIAGSIIPGIVGAAGAVIRYRTDRKNTNAQNLQNLRDRNTEITQDLIERKRAQEDWAAQNAYNSPEEQMNRLRQAGLNPNLVYGKGADNTAEAIRKSGGSNQKREVRPREGDIFSDSISEYYALQQMQAQTDNLHQMTALSHQEGMLKTATTAKILQDTARSKFDLGQAETLKDIVVKQAMLANQQTAENINLVTAQIVETLGRIDMQPQQKKLLLEQINNARQDGRMKEAEARLREKGISPNDPNYIRILMQMILDPEYFNQIKNRLK